MRKIMSVLLLSGLLHFAANAAADKAVLAGGCFWCMEADFEKLEGVKHPLEQVDPGLLANWLTTNLAGFFK